MLARTLSRPRWAMPITASWSPSAHGLVEKGVEQHDGRLGPLESEPLLPDVAGVEEPLEDLRRVEPVRGCGAAPRASRADGHALEVLLDPPLLAGILDVHVLDAECPAVGVAQDVEDLVEGGHVLAGQAVGHELARQVPDGQPVVQRVQLGVELGRLGVQGIEMGDEVAAHPVHVDQRLHVHLLDQAEMAAVSLVVDALASASQRTGS